MAESVKMAKFNHQNVMRLIGVCIDKGASPYIVMPYMVYGSLLSHLKKHRVDLTLASDQDQELVRLSIGSQQHTFLSVIMTDNCHTNKASFNVLPSCKRNVIPGT